MPVFFDPAVLFFVLGLFAGLVRSNLQIPDQVGRFLSLYLLMALGLKGGFAIRASGIDQTVIVSLGLAVAMAIAVPISGYLALRRAIGQFEAIGVAAVYGSVSAVTFIAATQYLDQSGIPYGGHMAAAMALMESPALVIALVLAHRARRRSRTEAVGATWQEGLRHALTDGSQLVLVGAMAVGILTGETGQKVMAPFSIDLFKGMLSFFLLDMGTVAATQLRNLAGSPVQAFVYAFAAPPIHALVALAIALAIGLPPGETVLLMVLSASASYIAVPAALRHAVPEATPGLYVGLSLGLTFPLNIVLGIPIYAALAHGAADLLGR